MEKIIKEKFLSHIIAVSTFAVFIALGLACASTPEETAGYTPSSGQPIRKTTTNQNIYSFSYAEFNDGCLVLSSNFHFRAGTYSAGYGGVLNQISPPQHRNDNAVVRAEINRFNNEIKRLDAVTENNQQAILNSTPIGSWYFVYRSDQIYIRRNYFPNDRANEGIPFTETGVMYTLNIWRINVVAAR